MLTLLERLVTQANRPTKAGMFALAAYAIFRGGQCAGEFAYWVQH